MFDVIIDGRVVATILAWDRNDAAVYASRRFGPSSGFVIRRAVLPRR